MLTTVWRMRPLQYIARRAVVTTSPLAATFNEIPFVWSYPHPGAPDVVKPNTEITKRTVEAVEIEVKQATSASVDQPGRVNGTPPEQYAERRVRIFSPSKAAPQSGTHNTHRWRLEFEALPRWENPYMGWTSSADPVSCIHLDFDSEESAIEYCRRYGYSFTVEERHVIQARPKSYGNNFSWNRRTRVSTK